MTAGAAFMASAAQRLHQSRPEVLIMNVKNALAALLLTVSFVSSGSALPLPGPPGLPEPPDLEGLIQMPLAVAEIAEIDGLPLDPLGDVLQTMNAAAVPPAEFIDVLRYVPVALVEASDRDFVRFVSSRQQDGLRGVEFLNAVRTELRTYDIPDLVVTAPRIVQVNDDYVPEAVVRRVARRHPHGGPPGQLKKIAGLQTGAEIVHGRAADVRSDRDDRARKPAKAEKPHRAEKREKSVRGGSGESRKITQGGGKQRGGGKAHDRGPKHGGGKGNGKGKG